MRTTFILFIGIIFFFACSKKKDNSGDSSITSCSSNPANYSDASGTKFTISFETWYLSSTSNGGGSVYVRCSGNTNADSAKFQHYSDGVPSDRKIQLDASKNFNLNTEISITSSSVPQGEFQPHTILKVYKFPDSLIVTVAGCTLKY